MKTHVKLMGAVALAAVLGGVGCAGTKEAKRDVEAAVPGLSQKREGLVVSVDAKRNLVEVNDVNNPAAPPAWFALTPGTRLERQGQRVNLNDISEGTPVRVSYEPATGPEEAYTIEVLTGEKADEVRLKAQHEGLK